jgi:hypothetical protein
LREGPLSYAANAVRDGQAWASAGARHTVALELTMALARTHSYLDPESVGAFFAPAAAATGPEFCGDYIAKMFAGAVARQQQEQHGRKVAELAAANKAILAATRGTRQGPYTPEELRAWSGRPWLLQRDGAYFTFVDGTYRGPYTAREALPAIWRDLSPAEVAGAVELEQLNGRGTLSHKPLERLMKDYGQVLSAVEYSYLQETAFDPKQSKLTLQTARPANREPMEHPGVGEWLDLLGGQPLRDWLSYVLLLDRALPVLLLTHAKGAGKSALAAGLARLWEHGMPASAERVFGRFNGDLLHTPLVFADEEVPADDRGRQRSSTLRRFVQEHRRTIEAKFLPNMMLEGHARLIIAANNMDVLHVNESLTANDLAAISERILHIPVHDGAAKFIEDVGHERFREWILSGVLARHVSWLAAHAAPVPNERFLVKSPSPHAAQTLATGTTWSSEVCAWLMKFLEHPERLQQRADPICKHVFVKQGKLFVYSAVLTQHWDAYGDPRLQATARHIGRALAGLASGRTTPAGVSLRVIDQDMLATWAEGVCRDRREVYQAFAECEKKLEARLS